jgi:hypothetical protein
MEPKPTGAKESSQWGSEEAVPPDVSQLSILSNTAHPTFSIQLPFVLLGSRSLPDYIYSNAERQARPLHVIQHVIQQECSNVNATVWISRDFNESDIKLPEANRAERLKKAEEKRAELAEQEKLKWEEIKKSGWIIRHGAEQRRLGWLGRWKEGDGELTARERLILPESVWNVPVVLQRLDVDVRMKDMVIGELSKILDVLNTCFSGKNIGHDQNMVVVCNHKCKLKISIQPASGIWGINTASKVLLALAAWERELVLTDTMTGVISYRYLSRFMARYEIRQLHKERRRLWSLSGGTKATYDFEKEAWEKEVQQEDIWNAINQPELWSRICDFVREGDWKIADFIDVMEKYEERGSRMAVSMSVAHGAPETVMTGVEESQSDDNAEEPEHPKTQNVDEEQAADGVQSVSSKRSSNHESLLPVPLRGIKAVVFQSHRGNLDIKDISAYTDLVTRLIHQLVSISYSQLKCRTSSFRGTVTNLEETPTQGLNRLLQLLDVEVRTQRYYNDLCIQRDIERAGKDFEQLEEKCYGVSKTEVLDKTPFCYLVKLLEKQRKREWRYIPEFISRYAGKGGFHAVTRPKLYQLLRAEDKKRKEKKAEAEMQDRERRETARQRRIAYQPNVSVMSAKSPVMPPQKYEIGAKNLVPLH